MSGVKVNTCISDMPSEGQWCPFKQPEERAGGSGEGPPSVQARGSIAAAKALPSHPCN